MRAPPPLTLELHGSRLERALHVALHAAAAAAAAAWAVGWPHDAGDTAALAAAGLAAGLAGAGLGWLAYRPVCGPLVWDGQTWTLQGHAGQLRVLIDAGPWLALRFTQRTASRRSARWFIVGRRDAGPAWHALRAAVYCPDTQDPTADRTTAPPDRPA
jgi:hypothetical protein